MYLLLFGLKKKNDKNKLNVSANFVCLGTVNFLIQSSLKKLNYLPTLTMGKPARFFKINGTYVSFSGYISLFDILEWKMVNSVVFGLK